MSKSQEPKLFVVGKKKFSAEEIERLIRLLRHPKTTKPKPKDKLRLDEFRQNLAPGFIEVIAFRYGRVKVRSRWFRYGTVEVSSTCLLHLLNFLHDERISFREFQILLLLNLHLHDREIAGKLQIGIRNVHTRMRALTQKLNLTSDQLSKLCG